MVDPALQPFQKSGSHLLGGIRGSSETLFCVLLAEIPYQWELQHAASASAYGAGSSHWDAPVPQILLLDPIYIKALVSILMLIFFEFVKWRPIKSLFWKVDDLKFNVS